MTEQDLIRRISDGFEAAKGGDAINQYNEVAPHHDKGTLPAKSHYAFAWIIYYALHQMPEHEIELRKRMLARYLRLNVTKPHKLHSMILTEAIRLYRNAKETAFGKREEGTVKFSIMRFSNLWNLTYLRPGDWRRKEYEGKTMGSTVEKFITLYVDEADETETMPSPEFMTVIDNAVREYPDSYNLMSQRASLHILSGDCASARSLLRDALLLAPGKFHLWSKLASLIPEEENLRLKVALLYKALSAPGPDRYKGKIRLSLAIAWLSINAFPRALWELQQVKSIYEANGWHLSPTFNAAWKRIPADTAASDPTQSYRKVEQLALDEIYSSLPAISATKTYHKNPDISQTGKGYGKPAVAWRVTDSDGNNYWIKPERFRIPVDLPAGTAVTLRIHNGKPVAVSLLQQPN